MGNFFVGWLLCGYLWSLCEMNRFLNSTVANCNERLKKFFMFSGQTAGQIGASAWLQKFSEWWAVFGGYRQSGCLQGNKPGEPYGCYKCPNTTSAETLEITWWTLWAASKAASPRRAQKTVSLTGCKLDGRNSALPAVQVPFDGDRAGGRPIWRESNRESLNRIPKRIRWWLVDGGKTAFDKQD